MGSVSIFCEQLSSLIPFLFSHICIEVVIIQYVSWSLGYVCNNLKMKIRIFSTNEYFLVNIYFFSG